jgi:cell division protein FtsB
MEQIEIKRNPNMSISDMNISEETLQKAQEILELASAEVEKVKQKNELTKSEEEVARLTDELTKAVAAVTVEQKKFADGGLPQEDQGQEDEDGGKIEKNPKKGEEGGAQKSVHAYSKSDEDDLNKSEAPAAVTKEGLEIGGESVIDLIKGLGDNFDKKLSSLATLYEAEREENEELKKSIEILGEKVQELQDSPAPRKSVIAKSAVERFAEANPDAKVFSMSRNRTAVIDKLYELSGIEKGIVDEEISKAMQDAEAAGWIEPRTQKRLQDEHNIMIVK